MGAAEEDEEACFANAFSSSLKVLPSPAGRDLASIPAKGVEDRGGGGARGKT